MCACRIDSSPTRPQNLEDYYQYLSMEEENPESEVSDPDDVYAELAKKDKDLILAAELGKALLESNEDLQNKNEQLQADYQKTFEDLEQEKYGLRFRLEVLEGEYDNTVREMQADIKLLRRRAEESEQNARSGYREKSHIVEGLTAQNERLTEQLKKATQQEQAVSTQFQSLREQMQSRRSTMHDHVHQLEILREEITLLNERKTELERRITQLSGDRDSLSINLEESQDRIVMLEKQCREQEQVIRTQTREIESLQATNSDLEDKVECLSLQTSTTSFCQNNSLMSELEMSSGLDHNEMEGIQSGMKTHVYPLSPSPGLNFADLDDDDDIECDDDDLALSGILSNSFSNHSRQSSDARNINLSCQSSLHLQNFDDDKEIKQEVLTAFGEIKRMCQSIESAVTQDEMDKSSTTSDREKNRLITAIDRVEHMIETMVSGESDTDKNQDIVMSRERVTELNNKVSILEADLELIKDQYESVKTSLKENEDELEKKNAEFVEIKRKLTLQELQLQHLELEKVQQERDNYSEKVAHLGADEMISTARKDRDQAIRKKNGMEIELATSKLDLMSLDKQLMDAIQQKIKLSQQLEQWQMDMQELLDMQMHNKLEDEEMKEKEESSPSKQNSKKFGFWS